MVWNALANLADVAGRVSISAKATPLSGYDNAKWENGVLEPLRERRLISRLERSLPPSPLLVKLELPTTALLVLSPDPTKYIVP